MAEMTAAEEAIHRDEFGVLLDTIEMLANRQMPTAGAPRRAWMHLCAGHARAYRSLYEARFGSFIKAVKSGMSARAAYQQGLDNDSSVYDLYFGLGSYHYWKSARAGFLKWLLLFKNEKEKGIAELHLAADSGVVFSDAAHSALIWVWLNEKIYDSAIVAAEVMHRRFPEGRSFLWPLAQALVEDKQYRRALDIYRELRTTLTADPGNYYNLIQCDYLMAYCLEQMRLTGEAAEVAHRLQDYEDSIPDRTRRRQRSRLDYLRRLNRL
jgi:hypothetical protein